MTSMPRFLFILLALAVTASAQDEGAPGPLARVMALLAPADDSARDSLMHEQTEVTGADLFEGLEDLNRSTQLEEECERLVKELKAVKLFSLSNILDSLRVYFLGGETAWRKEFDMRSAKIDELLARSQMALASSEFVKVVHDAERGVSFSCPPDHTMGEMFEIVRVWLKENPGEQHLPAEMCVINALKAQWPKTGDNTAGKDLERNAQSQGTEQR
jgi:hypothetical protein